MRRVPALLFLAACAMAPARAQEAPTIHQSLAELIHEAMAPTAWSGAHDSWGAVSIRISSLMHWHLAPPDTPGKDSIKRNGWLSAAGRQVGITAYGEGDRVASVAFELAGSPFGPDPDDRELLAALAADGVTVADTQRRPYPSLAETPRESNIYTLAAKDRRNTTLSSSTHCTPPMSRAARMCWVTYELSLGD